MPKHLARTTCARATRDAILATYPKAADDPVLWRALVYLLFTSLHDQESRKRLIGSSSLEWINGEPIYHPHTGEDVLNKIRSELLPDFSWSGWKPGERPRLVHYDGISSQLYRIVEDDLMTPVKQLEDRVRVLDGSRYDRRAQGQERKQSHAEVMALRDNAPSPTSRYLFDRMNSLDDRPANGFTKLLKHMDKAKVRCQQIEVERLQGQSDREYKRHQRDVRNGFLRLLRAIEDLPQPFYQFSNRGRTDRLFPYNPSILLLPGELRDILCQGAGWEELDLSSAHLAITAATWGVESVRKFLADGGSAWEEIMAHLGLDSLSKDNATYKHVKAAMKECMYATVYGMPEASIKGQFTKATKDILGSDAGQKLADCWLIRDLLEAREEQFEHIIIEGEVETPTGIQAAINVQKGVDECSVLSTVAQAYEAEIMRVILEYEEAHIAEASKQGKQPDFRVMLWQHDGCSLRFRRKRTTHLAELQRLVREAAEIFEIPTRLELKD